jgi:hypothetical protein
MNDIALYTLIAACMLVTTIATVHAILGWSSQ